MLFELKDIVSGWKEEALRLGVPIRRDGNVVLDVGEVWGCMLREGGRLAGELRLEVICATSLEKLARALCSRGGSERCDGKKTRHGGTVQLLSPHGAAQSSLLCSETAWCIP